MVLVLVTVYAIEKQREGRKKERKKRTKRKNRKKVVQREEKSLYDRNHANSRIIACNNRKGFFTPITNALYKNSMCGVALCFRC